jgi:hypothetical protein
MLGIVEPTARDGPMEPRKGRVTRMPPAGERPAGERRTVVYELSGRGGSVQGVVAGLVALAILGVVVVLGILTAVVALWIALGAFAVAAVVAIVRGVLGGAGRAR